MLDSIKKHPFSSSATVYFFILVLWWLKINLFSHDITAEHYFFNLSYIVFNLLGGIGGLIIAHEKWGGFSSHIGKGLAFLSFGLLGQGFGLIIWTFYNLVLQVGVPYPSLADIGYFSLIPFYALAMLNFAQASGAKFALQKLSGQLKIIIIPLIILILCYAFFLRNIGLDLTNPLKTFLDFAYPFGEAITVSLGLITFTLSRGLLGGSMKRRVEYIIIALVFQFITEFTFLYTAAQGLYFNASFVDLMYATSYFLMTLAILSFRFIEDQ